MKPTSDLQVPCPTCQSQPGVLCVSNKGTKLQRAHIGRQRMAHRRNQQTANPQGTP